MNNQGWETWATQCREREREIIWKFAAMNSQASLPKKKTSMLLMKTDVCIGIFKDRDNKEIQGSFPNFLHLSIVRVLLENNK